MQASAGAVLTSTDQNGSNFEMAPTRRQKDADCNSMNGFKDFWNTLFFTLYRNRVSDEKLIPMWKQFKREHLTMDEVKEAFQNGEEDFSERAQETFRTICANAKSCGDLLDRMNDEPGIDNTDWGVLVKKIRDRESRPLDINMTLDVKKNIKDSCK